MSNCHVVTGLQQHLQVDSLAVVVLASSTWHMCMLSMLWDEQTRLTESWSGRRAALRSRSSSSLDKRQDTSCLARLPTPAQSDDQHHMPSAQQCTVTDHTAQLSLNVITIVIISSSSNTSDMLLTDFCRSLSAVTSRQHLRSASW